LEKIKLGSLYFDGVPCAIGPYYDNQVLTIGDTDPVNPITWIKSSDGLLVADHTVCIKISWEQLDKMGFIFGRPIKIDGVPYLCRSLKVGAEEGVPNEWYDLLDELGDEDSIWHWKNSFFWGQETVTARAAYRARCGYFSARLWNYSSASYRSPSLGFRPVLEPLGPEPLISDTLIGSRLKILGPTGPVSGVLSELTDYDLVLMDTAPDFTPGNWCSLQSDGDLVIDRTTVSYISIV